MLCPVISCTCYYVFAILSCTCDVTTCLGVSCCMLSAWTWTWRYAESAVEQTVHTSQLSSRRTTLCLNAAQHVCHLMLLLFNMLYWFVDCGNLAELRDLMMISSLVPSWLSPKCTFPVITITVIFTGYPLLDSVYLLCCNVSLKNYAFAPGVSWGGHSITNWLFVLLVTVAYTLLLLCIISIALSSHRVVELIAFHIICCMYRLKQLVLSLLSVAQCSTVAMIQRVLNAFSHFFSFGNSHTNCENPETW